MAMSPIGLVAAMVLENGHRWGECATPEQWADMRALLDAPGGPRKHFWLRARGRSKPLALDTPLPTPSGWTTMGTIAPGDALLDENGQPCRVTYVAPVMLGEDCWRVTFDDGSSVVASGAHEWCAEDHRCRARRNRRGLSSPHQLPGGVAALPVVTTRQMADGLRYGPRGDLDWSVPCARPWDLPEAHLPLPPYVVGFWLGDGSAHTGAVTVGDQDLPEIGAAFQAVGFPLHSPQRKPDANCATWRAGASIGSRSNGRGPRVYALTVALRALGVLSAKHIPAMYLRASEKQRLELLRGLMDADGHAVPGGAVFHSTERALADGVAEIVTSFGWKARLTEFRAKLNGRDCGACYKVTFRPDVSPFSLARKTARLRLGAGRAQVSRHTSRMVRSVERVPSVPVRCITVDSPSHLYLAGRSGVPTHNTFDAGAATLAMMLSGSIRAGDEVYAAAAGREQAGLLARKIQAIGAQTPELAGAVEVQQYRVVTKRTGAVLDVLSAELATSWGKTPRWLFIDEICNHEAHQRASEFIDSLLTSMVKRRDSVCLIGSTPGGPEHWSRTIWDAAEDDPLWRRSRVAGPAPWQDPAELASERRRLPEFMWKRLFECEWAASGDTLADDEALDACTLHDGPLEPEPGTAYVVGFDLSVSTDHTAAVVAHMGLRDGRRVVVADRVEAWIPRGGKVPLGDVEAWISMAARDYNAALIVGDPWQASQMTDNLRQAGHRVQPVSLSAGTQSRRAQMLLRLVRDRALDLPEDAVLRKEFLSLRLAEGTTPGVLRLSSDGSSAGHFDRVMALSFAAEELLARPGQSWREFNGDTVECASCGRVILAAMPACRFCSAANPAYRAPVKREAAPRPAPGSWASAYLPKGAVRCPRCESGWMDPERQQACDRCTRGGGGMPGLRLPSLSGLRLRLREEGPMSEREFTIRLRGFGGDDGDAVLARLLAGETVPAEVSLSGCAEETPPPAVFPRWDRVIAVASPLTGYQTAVLACSVRSGVLSFDEVRIFSGSRRPIMREVAALNGGRLGGAQVVCDPWQCMYAALEMRKAGATVADFSWTAATADEQGRVRGRLRPGLEWQPVTFPLVHLPGFGVAAENAARMAAAVLLGEPE